MIRIKRSFLARKRKRKIFKMNRGVSSRRLFRIANQKTIKAKLSAYHNRKNRKRLFRNLWTHRINAATRLDGLNFNQLINLCRHSEIQLNRKILSQLIIHDPESFFIKMNQVKGGIYA